MAIQIGSGVTFGGGFTVTDQPLEAVLFGASATDGGMFGWRWNNTTGFGAQYTSLPSTPTYQTPLAFNRTSTVLVNGWTATARAFPWNSDTGTGTVYATSSGVPGQTADITFNNAGDVVFIRQGTSPFIKAFRWSDATGWGTQYANPSVLPSAGIDNIAFIGPR